MCAPGQPARLKANALGLHCRLGRSPKPREKRPTSTMASVNGRQPLQISDAGGEMLQVPMGNDTISLLHPPHRLVNDKQWLQERSGSACVDMCVCQHPSFRTQTEPKVCMASPRHKPRRELRATYAGIHECICNLLETLSCKGIRTAEWPTHTEAWTKGVPSSLRHCFQKYSPAQ